MGKKRGGKNELKVLENDEKMSLEVSVKNGQARQNVISMPHPQSKGLTTPFCISSEVMFYNIAMF